MSEPSKTENQHTYQPEAEKGFPAENAVKPGPHDTATGHIDGDKEHGKVKHAPK